jgi:hypothetical protein
LPRDRDAATKKPAAPSSTKNPSQRTQPAHSRARPRAGNSPQQRARRQIQPQRALSESCASPVE